MRLLIAVPSKNRVNKFYEKTYSFLQYAMLDWRVFVEPQDYPSYAKKFGENNVVNLGQDDKGLGFSLMCISEYALQFGYDFVWKMDDDFSHWYKGKNKVVTRVEEAKYLGEIASLLEQKATDIGGLFGGFNFGTTLLHNDWSTYTHINKMSETTYIVRPDRLVTPVLAGGYNEEFFVTMNVLNAREIIFRVGLYAWSANLSTLSGGMQSFDREKESMCKMLEAQSAYHSVYGDMFLNKYRQKDGRVFVVTDKTKFNKKYSQKL